MWKWDSSPASMGPGTFCTLTGPGGISALDTEVKESITAIRISLDDDVGTNLTQWLLFCDIGSILYIRRVDKVQEVAYYQVTNVSMYGTGLVRYFVTYIDGDGTPPVGISDENTYINNAQYYIGYLPSSSVSPANAVTFLTLGEPFNSVENMQPGNFSFQVDLSNSNPGWDDHVGKMVISTQSSNGVNIKKWLEYTKPGSILTIRQRGNTKNFAHYKLLTSFIPIDGEYYGVKFEQINFADVDGFDGFALSYDNRGVGIPYDGVSEYPQGPDPSPQSGWIVANGGGDTVGNQIIEDFKPKYEYEISYINMGEIGPVGGDGIQGETGVAGMDGVQGPQGETGIRGFDGNSSIWNANTSGQTPTTGLFHFNQTGIVVNCLDLNSVIMTSWFAQAAPNDIIIVREVNNPEKVGYFRLITVFTALPLPTPEGTCVADVSYISGIDYTSNWPEITSPPTSYYISYVVSGQSGPAGVDGAQGPIGLTGPAGLDGTDGVDGVDGLPGADGTDGVDGAPGLPGADGTDGVDGAIGKMGYDGNSSLWLSNGDDMNNGPVSSGSLGYFRISFATAPWGTDTTTHALTISEATSQPNPTNYNEWFQFIDPYDVLTIRDDTQPDNVMHFQVLPLSPTNGQPPNGTNGPYIGAYQSGTMFNLRLKLINSAPNGTGMIDGGPFPLDIPCYVGYVKTGPTGPTGVDGANGIDGTNGTNGTNGSNGTNGTNGTNGAQGPIGFDGNSSRWKYSEFGNGPFMGAGYFTTGTGFFGLSVNQQTEKDQVNAIRINKTDDNTVTPDLTDWLLFCDIGSLIYIRKVNQVDEVAYYSVTGRIDSFNTGQEVKYIVNYIDGDDSPGLFADDEEYYIGYINTSTNSPANAVRFLGIGIADTTPPSTETNPGKFSLTVPSVNTSPIPSWNDANGIVISGEDINNTPIQKWIQGIRENAIVTISQRGNPTNFSHYKMTGTFSELALNTGVWMGGFQSQGIGINQYSIAYDSQGIATPYDGSTPPDIPSGWIIKKHPNNVYIDPATGPVIDTGYNSSYTINYEYEISYSNAGIDGAGGVDGTDGADGTPGLPGADGADGNSGGAVGVSFSMDLRGTPTTWAGSGAPPETVSVEPLGPYILYTGEDSTNNGIIPRLPKNFEFIHLEGNSWASAPNPNPGYFPSTEWVQSVNLHETAVNEHKLPQLGPISNESLTSYNNFYGFRVPQDGKMVGFQINYIQKAMTGQFYAMYYKPDSENPTVIFNKGGPLVGGMNSSGPILTNYASGNTIWDEATSIPVKANGFIFVMSDLSCRLGGAYTNNWNSGIGPGPAIPFRPPSGKIHATVYLTYD